MPRARDLGIEIGALPTGPTNSVLDVAGVGLGHTTVHREEPLVARTGVTCLLLAEDAYRAGHRQRRALETVIEGGSPALQILHGVGAHRADLIVMGTHGANGFERLLLGSITEKVVRKAGCPVLTVPPRAHSSSRLPFRRILCPIDFLPASAAGLRFALSMAQEAEAELLLLHVLEWPIGHEPPPLPRFNVPEYRVYREREAAAELERLVPSSARDWCEVSTHLVHGKPYEQVLAFAGDHAVDLIVIGVHGRNALDVAMFGSTTNQVIRVRAARCSRFGSESR